MQPPAVAAGFVARVHLSARGRLESLAGSHDAVGHGNLVARSDRESTCRIATVADTQLPLLVAEFKAHVQVIRLGRLLAP